MTEKDIRNAATALGIHCDTYSPGDGVTRYRFFTQPTDYFAGSGLWTCFGAKSASDFLDGVGIGQSLAKEKTGCR